MPAKGDLVRALTVGALLSWGVPAEPAPPAAESPLLEIGERERLVVLAPHPDDETLGVGGLVQRVLAREGSVRVVILTAGDGYLEAVAKETGEPRPRPAEFVAYGERRMAEARAAVRELGGERVRFSDLGFPDGGLQPLLHEHWKRMHPERSPTTLAVRPPYPDALDGQLLYDGADLRAALVRLLRESQPTLVALPDPLDVHPDHSATGSFALLAIGDWIAGADRAPAKPPRLIGYLVHWPSWPPGANGAPARSSPGLELPADLPARGLARVSLALAPSESAAKGRALERHESQQKIMPDLFAAFVGSSEPFSVFTQAEVQVAEKEIEGRVRAAPAQASR